MAQPGAMLLITGSTGQLGTLVIDELLKRIPATQIVAGARTVANAGALAARGVVVRELDYDRPAALDAALVGIDRVLLISASVPGDRVRQHAAVIDAAKRAGVRLLAYTSILHGERSQMLLAAEHVATERAIRATGVPFVLLRNGWYIENYVHGLAAAIGSGVVFGAAKDGKLAPAARRDFAEAAAVVLTTEGHENTTYELAGDRALTMAELAAEIARVSGKPVTYRDLPQNEYATALVGVGVPQAFAEILADSDAGIARGDLDDRSGDLHRLINRPTTPIENVFAGAASAVAASHTTPDMNSSSVSSSTDDKEAVAALPLAYFSALRDRNIGAVLALYSDGGELSAPFMPPAAGAPALRTTYENLFKAVRFEMTHNVNAVTVMSQVWAFVRTSSTGTTVTLATGEARPSAFEELFVLRKDNDGKWRIARYMTTPI